MTFDRLKAQAATVIMLAATSIPRPVSAQIHVGAAVQVSGSHPAAAHTEYFIDADPSRGERMVICSMAVDPSRNRITSVLYASSDSGRSWRMALNDTVSSFGSSMDPACVVGPAGVVLFATLPTQMDPTQPDPGSVTRIHRSVDGGRTWAPPQHIRFLDNEDMVVDRTTGPYRDRIYIAGTRAIPNGGGARNLAWFYSSDSGRTFAGPLTSDPAPGTIQGGVSAPIVLADGSLLVPSFVHRASARPAAGGQPQVSDTVPERAVSVVRIHEGGTRADPPVRIAATAPCAGTGGPPMLAQDRTTGPFRNRIYASFVDGAQGRCQIMLSWSDDGNTWSRPLPVDDPAIPGEEGKGPDAFFPQVAVNNKGVVGITWYDRREDPLNRAFRQRFTASADGGNSVMRSVPVSSKAHAYATGSEREPYFGVGMSMRDRAGPQWLTVTTGRSYRTLNSVGDYGGFTARADGAFQAVWVDNRTGVPQLFTAPVRVRHDVMTPEARDARLGRRITDSVSVHLSRTTFDPATCTMSLGVVVINRTGRALRSPVAVRIDALLSQLGIPRLVGEQLDDLGRPILRIEASSGEGTGRYNAYQSRVIFDECRPLPAAAEESHRHRLDARLAASPGSRITGPKMLVLKAEVFEPSVTR